MSDYNNDLALYPAYTGLRTPFGVFLPVHTKVAAYVRSTGVQNNEDWITRQEVPLYTTLAAGLNACRADLGDTVIVLPGHSESFTDNTILDNLKANTTILGMGDPSKDDAPTLRITNTAGQFVMNDDNVSIIGMRLRLEGANGITKAINITGAGCTIEHCNIEVASGATAKSAIAIEVGTGAHSTKLVNNYIRGTAAHNVTDGIKVVAAVNDLLIAKNHMQFSATAANGLIHFTAAALRLGIFDNYLYNTMTLSEHCVTIDDVAADGLIIGNRLATLEGAAVAPAATGFSIGTSALIKFFDNEALGVAKVSGDIAPARDT